MTTEHTDVLQKMKTRIDRIEKEVSALEALGPEIPAVQKNCRNIRSAVYNLKFGISDIADIYEA